MKPSKELEQEIMEWVFSKDCSDHHGALKVWNGNPWNAVSMYEIHHYPANLSYQICFPEEVKIPTWFQKKLAQEEQLAMQGDPVIIPYPRAEESSINVDGEEYEINKFGRLLVPIGLWDNEEEDGKA